MFVDNECVITSSAIPHSTLGKHWNVLSCHHVCEAVTGGWLRFFGNGKSIQWFAKAIAMVQFEHLCQAVVGMVDAPLGTSDPEDSDAGLGLTVPDEQLSQEQDLSRLNGHTILAVPCGNECTAQFDAMPTDNES